MFQFLYTPKIPQAPTPPTPAAFGMHAHDNRVGG
ncbi:uncharacterized protein METZ01_LOCUS217986, partial [marine metagenome]